MIMKNEKKFLYMDTYRGKRETRKKKRRRMCKKAVLF